MRNSLDTTYSIIIVRMPPRFKVFGTSSEKASSLVSSMINSFSLFIAKSKKSYLFKAKDK